MNGKDLDVQSNVRGHFVIDDKNNGRQKSFLAGDGNLAEVTLCVVHSGVVSPQGMYLALFLVKLNILQLWRIDAGNTCLKASTKIRHEL